jgi:HD-like signal output (HDOD) protein
LSALSVQVFSAIVDWMSEDTTMDRTEKPQNGRLALYVEHLLERSELPMFSQQLLELLSLPTEDPKAARKLFELVSEDYALTCKVLKTANSFHYNRSNRAIESVSQAIFVLGVGAVRNLASTLICFQTKQTHSTALQQLMTKSMVSAQVASVVAHDTGFGDPEVGYLAAMLYNLGEVLVAHHSPDQHQVIQEQVKAGVPRELASIKELGFAFDHLASFIGHHWKLSPNICAIWEPRAAKFEIPQLARFANELTRAMCLDANQSGAVALLAMRYGVTLRMKGDDMFDVWERSVLETQEVFNSLGVPFASLGVPVPEHLIDPTIVP